MKRAANKSQMCVGVYVCVCSWQVPGTGHVADAGLLLSTRAALVASCNLPLSIPGDAAAPVEPPTCLAVAQHWAHAGAAELEPGLHAALTGDDTSAGLASKDLSIRSRSRSRSESSQPRRSSKHQQEPSFAPFVYRYTVQHGFSQVQAPAPHTRFPA